MSLAKCIAAVVIVSLLGSIGASEAAEKKSSTKMASGRYRLVNGKGYTVCEAFLKNLNAFPADEPPMMCEQKIHPTHPEFTRPKWEEMDVQKNLNIVYAAEALIPEFTPVGSKPPPIEQWVKSFQERIASGKVTPHLMKTVIALNSRGPETLIAYRPITNRCKSDVAQYGSNSSSDDELFVLHAGSEHLLETFSGGSAFLRHEILSFKSKPYFVLTGSEDADTSYIKLYSVSPLLPEMSGTTQYVLLDRCGYNVSKSVK